MPLVADYLGGVDVKPGDIVLFENVRFNKGEKKNSDELAQQYAALCDVFVMDAFGTAHRADARDVARRSLVLLKNQNNALQLLDSERSLAGLEARVAESDLRLINRQIDLFQALGNGCQPQQRSK